MPTYCYECPDCDGQQEHFLSITSHPEVMACSCGGTAAMLFNWQGDCFAKGNERQIKLDPTCVPIGWDRGNTGAQQEERYRRIVNDTAKRARSVDKQAIKGGIRHIARMPRELQRLRQSQYGKAYLDPSQQSADELKSKLRSDGVLFHRN